MPWPKRPYEWIDRGVLHISVPFTWNLPAVQRRIKSVFMPVRVGGPAVQLMPDYLHGAEIGGDLPFILTRVNPLATRTTAGCPSRCKFCGIGKGLIERGGFRELDFFPDGPEVCDNNFLAASERHIERVVNMLRPWKWAEFSQGLDASLVTQEKAEMIASIGKPIIRMALDSHKEKTAWEKAYDIWRSVGTPKNRIRSYALIGFNTGPDEAWERCLWLEKFNTKPVPMWFHPLDTLVQNSVTEDQKRLGWTDYERRRIMQWFYWHKEAVQ